MQYFILSGASHLKTQRVTIKKKKISELPVIFLPDVQTIWNLVRRGQKRPAVVESSVNMYIQVINLQNYTEPKSDVDLTLVVYLQL